jgi:DNA-binding NarL/FixJ family response regulator
MSASSSGPESSPSSGKPGYRSAPDARLRRASPAKILIVEPHPVRRESAAFLLDRQSDLVTCGTATSIAEAEEMLQIVAPDLVVVNLGARPQAGDEEKIRALRSAHPSLPLLTVVRPPASSAPGSLTRNLPGSAWSICRVPADLLASVRQTLIEGSSFRTSRAAA